MLRLEMNAQQALADLTEISSQIQVAVVFDGKGKVAGSTLADARRADELAQAAQKLLAAAESVEAGKAKLTQLEIATDEGSVFIVRGGTTCIAATTGRNPTGGLVFYDLKSTLRSVKPATTRKPAAPRKKATAASAKKKTAAKKPTTRKKPDAS
jgi:predicted regulator of Ras-like GTPase activity (Roadblock/LC7/MglB family)